MITQEQIPMLAIPSMNDTHLEETLIINRLESAAKSSDIEGVSKILRELLEHTALHFSDEEDMMEEALYPAFQAHKSEHDRHLHELDALIKYFDKNRDVNAIIAHIDGNLARWVLYHMETMDAVMAKYLEEGLSGGCGATKGCTTGSC
ncbi:MAG: hemerythrin family protein [Campylobacterota bacterium]|nr:hemerythrin family protein [Campylobacterota bacterium]